MLESFTQRPTAAAHGNSIFRSRRSPLRRVYAPTSRWGIFCYYNEPVASEITRERLETFRIPKNPPTTRTAVGERICPYPPHVFFLTVRPSEASLGPSLSPRRHYEAHGTGSPG